MSTRALLLTLAALMLGTLLITCLGTGALIELLWETRGASELQSDMAH